MKRLKTVGAVAAIALLMVANTLGAVTRDEVLKKGLRSDYPHSYALMLKAGKAGSAREKQAFLTEALTLSPDLPGLYFALARASMPDISESIGYLVRGAKVYSKNFWWSMNLKGLLYVCLMLSLLFAVALTGVLRFFQDLPLIAHDMSENKAKLLLLPVALLPAALGVMGLIAGLLFLSGFYVKKKNRAVFYFTVLLLLLSPLFIRIANTYFSSPSPELRAVVAVNEFRDNGFAVRTLQQSTGFLPRFSYATALKREGRIRESIGIFSSLAEERPGAKVYTNLGNAYVAAGRYDKAKEAYNNALRYGRSAVTLYNLSQVHRDEFDYSTGDKYYDEALAADRNLVTGFTEIAGKTPNRLVVDETFPKEELEKFAEENRGRVINVYPVSPYAASATGAVLLVLFALLDKAITCRAYRCSRCGQVACRKCTTRKGSGRNICQECYRLQVAPDAETPQARVARILSSSEQKNRAMAVMRVLSFAPPGIVQVYSGRVFSGFVYLWLFLFAVITLALNPLFTTGMAFFSHSWLTPLMVLAFVIPYLISIITTQRRVQRGWL